jgi:hypothetical protein
MPSKQVYTFFFLLLFSNFLYAQKRFKVTVKVYDTWRKKYSIINERGKLIRRLDTAKYFTCFNYDHYVYFAVFDKKGSSGWTAIDANEKVLFKVFNTSSGEPKPDELREGMIRIVDDRGKIGFANYKGEVVIRPQFEAVSTFYKGKAIIGRECHQLLWCCEGENEDKHYVTDCKQAGYINMKGQVLKIGDWTFEQMQKQLGWKSEYDD